MLKKVFLFKSSSSLLTLYLTPASCSSSYSSCSGTSGLLISWIARKVFSQVHCSSFFLRQSPFAKEEGRSKIITRKVSKKRGKGWAEEKKKRKEKHEKSIFFLTHQVPAKLVVIIFTRGVRPSVRRKQKHATALKYYNASWGLVGH